MKNGIQTAGFNIISTLQAILFVCQSGLAFMVGYLLILTGASRRASTNTNLQKTSKLARFLIIIPAHNEEKLIGSTLDSLANLDYPPSHRAVHVIADNCTDKTDQIASEKGATVHIRCNQEMIGKGYALQWLLEQIWQENIPHDAVLFLDADSLVSPNFLQVMSARLANGEKVIQAYYAVREPENSWNSALRYAALAVLHYLRPQGRMVLGGSAGLKGNGMVFAADIIKCHPWSASITEDIEQHMALILSGERVTFAPDAVVLGEMPENLVKMHSQHMRWERGRLETARKYVPVLLQASGRELSNKNPARSFLLFDAAMEHIIPPFSVIAGLSGISFLASVLLGKAASNAAQGTRQYSGSIRIGKTNLLLGFLLILGQAIYLITGLRLVKASRDIYLKLLYAPLLVVWKMKQYMQALMVRGQLGWNRTTRNEE